MYCIKIYLQLQLVQLQVFVESFDLQQQPLGSTTESDDDKTIEQKFLKALKDSIEGHGKQVIVM